MRIKEWDKLTLHEKISWLPDRHSFPVKCLLYLMFNVTTDVPWEVAHGLLERMGYLAITVEEDRGNGMSIVTKTWTTPEGKVRGVDP